MLQAIGKYAQREGLHLCHSFLLALAIGQDAWKLQHLGQPAPIIFLFMIYR